MIILDDEVTKKICFDQIFFRVFKGIYESLAINGQIRPMISSITCYYGIKLSQKRTFQKIFFAKTKNIITFAECSLM